ncbi:alpha-glucosidase/alpha-galactosidase [Paramagnetospirillum kuznetsovii]|uniref:Alpha-glucosidase/alpha-galactosidase n=1 Tax=Paramagnetospirillum kuznetsovii TaxID=2053833 RepID=A0A364NY22_9PROT|nr:alpha-glucosidase/alpha-galactosidase [Paramagnetospirillum kuznetsovii]RAU21966.1 alpha-glucosidase/alpha-galactosidase [Paramagnetospirillum kuznetsovii]
MGNVTKIAFLGAGSMSFGLSTFRDMFSSNTLAGSTLVLVDHNPEALARMVALAERMNRDGKAGMIIKSTTDRREAFREASFVINSIAIDRMRLWKQDFEIPKKHGIRHTLGENGGPGGLFFTMRTLPLIFDIIRDMQELCPNALFLNFSNPESRIVLAVAKYTPIKVLGLCHGIFMARGAICNITGISWHDAECWGIGLNHFQWMLQVRHRWTGEDLYPLLREKEKTFDPTFQPFSRKMFKIYGLWPSCSDDHMGEYLSFGWEGGEHGHDYEADAREREKLKTDIEAVLAGGPLPTEWTQSVGERTNVVVDGMINNRHHYLESAVVMNNGVIPNLPPDLAVEVPATVDAAGIHPVSLGPLPDAIQKLALMPAGAQQLAVEAAVHASKELALQALLADPVTNSSDAAVKLLDELWELNKPYIRKCV